MTHKNWQASNFYDPFFSTFHIISPSNFSLISLYPVSFPIPSAHITLKVPSTLLAQAYILYLFFFSTYSFPFRAVVILSK